MINTDELRLVAKQQLDRVERLMTQVGISCSVQPSIDNKLLAIKTQIEDREFVMCMEIDGVLLQDDSSLLIQLRGSVERLPALAKLSPGVCNQTSGG